MTVTMIAVCGRKPPMLPMVDFNKLYQWSQNLNIVALLKWYTGGQSCSNVCAGIHFV